MGGFVKKVTKPFTKVADKLIPNEVTKAVDSLPGPVKAALYVYGPTRPFIAAANAAATLNRAQGRGLGLGDLARLGLDYAAYGSSGGIGSLQVPGFNAAGQYVGPGSQFFGGTSSVAGMEEIPIDANTGLPVGVEASEGALSVTDPVVTKGVVTQPTFSTPSQVLATGDGAAMEATYEPRFGKTVGMEMPVKTPPVPTTSIQQPVAVNPTDSFLIEGEIANQIPIEQTPQLGEVGIKSAYETAGGGFEGIKAAAKEGAADFFGVKEFKQLGRAISERDALGTLKATKDLVMNNPSAVISSTSLMAYLTTPEPLPDETPELFEERKKTVNSLIARYGDQLGSDITNFDSAADYYSSFRSNLGYTNPADLDFYAEGGRAGRAFGGIMDIPMGQPRNNGAGIMELDYRQDGGFVPVGIKEKADDVPAMLSKNEFVFTADAVKGADPEGEGDVERGAQAMYNTMKRLESRVV
tara:strand:- start:1653 stop:3056 length:1404 start_codon:yes stop_codon:yes gene_type:complete